MESIIAGTICSLLMAIFLLIFGHFIEKDENKLTSN